MIRQVILGKAEDCSKVTETAERSEVMISDRIDMADINIDTSSVQAISIVFPHY